MDISQITDLLYVSARPRGEHAAHVNELGIRLVITLLFGTPAPELLEPPLVVLRLPALDSPLYPIPMRTLVRGVEEALPVLAAGHGVLTHCRWGRHRSVAMACCILIAQGLSAEEAMALVIERRPSADPHAFWIEPRIRKFERLWRHSLTQEATRRRRPRSQAHEPAAMPSSSPWATGARAPVAVARLVRPATARPSLRWLPASQGWLVGGSSAPRSPGRTRLRRTRSCGRSPGRSSRRATARR